VGNVYTKGKLSKKDVYIKVMEKHYPNGMKLYDDFEMLRFRNHVKDMFGDFDLPSNNRAIWARIADNAVLCDNGKYILPQHVKIDSELIERIHSYILNNERNTIAFYEIFERFKDELVEKTDITNWHYLQGVLRHRYEGEFELSKDTISKNSAEQKSIKIQIEEYIKEADKDVSVDELKDKFLGIASYTLGMAIANSPNVLSFGLGKYIHASKLVIDEPTTSRIKSLVDQALLLGIVSTRTFFSEVYEKEREFIRDNAIENHMALFSVLGYLFPNDYEFSRPFVAQKGTENINLDSVIREYLSQFDEIGVSDLKTYLEDKQIRIMNFSELLENISDEFVRADEDLLVRTSQLQLQRDTFSSIEESLKGIIGMKGYLAAKNVDAFFFFPDIGRRWNPYLLVSLIKRYGQNLKVLKDNIDYRYLTEILIRSDIGVQDYDDLLRYALSYESKRSSFTSIAQVEEFLKIEELISNSIPKNLLEDGTIIPGETRITINLRR
jgi:hypothetical protein